MSVASLARSGSVVVVIAAGLCAGPARAVAQEAVAGACPDAQLQPEPDRGTLERVAAAIVCLINRERSPAGHVALREDRRLDRSSTAHSADQVAHRYLAHERAGRPRMVERIRTAGYFNRAWTATYSENIGIAVRGSASAAVIVPAWMASTEHRANILYAPFRDVGVGIAFADPDPAFYVDHPSVIFTTDFGRRTDLPATAKGRKKRGCRRPRTIRLELAGTAKVRRRLCRPAREGG